MLFTIYRHMRYDRKKGEFPYIPDERTLVVPFFLWLGMPIMSKGMYSSCIVTKACIIRQRLEIHERRGRRSVREKKSHPWIRFLSNSSFPGYTWSRLRQLFRTSRRSCEAAFRWRQAVVLPKTLSDSSWDALRVSPFVLPSRYRTWDRSFVRQEKKDSRKSKVSGMYAVWQSISLLCDHRANGVHCSGQLRHEKHLWMKWNQSHEIFRFPDSSSQHSPRLHHNGWSILSASLYRLIEAQQHNNSGHWLCVEEYIPAVVSQLKPPTNSFLQITAF